MSLAASSSSYPLLNVFWSIFIFFLWVLWIWILIWIFIDIYPEQGVFRGDRLRLDLLQPLFQVFRRDPEAIFNLLILCWRESLPFIRIYSSVEQIFRTLRIFLGRNPRLVRLEAVNQLEVVAFSFQP